MIRFDAMFVWYRKIFAIFLNEAIPLESFHPSLLVTDNEQKMCWWKLIDVQKGFGHTGRWHLLITQPRIMKRSSQDQKSVFNVLKLSPIQSRHFQSRHRLANITVTNILLADILAVNRQLVNFYLTQFVYYNGEKEGIRSFLCGLLIFSAKMITLIQKSINFYCQVDGIYWTEIKNNFSIKCCSLSVTVTALHTGEVMLSNRFSFRVCVEMRNWL